ncbi:MAG: conjugal transfer protein TraX [Lachnospiraceae bacterium]|nr:conjugal transfer protein TraX [Lachnospiraceae bacterium]
MNENRFEVTGALLKWIAIVTMLIDHIGAAYLGQYLSFNYDAENLGFLWNLYAMMRHIGRFAFPIFIFLMVEGFYYTHNRAKYFQRMLLFSAISEIPFDLAFNQSNVPATLSTTTFLEFHSQNVFFTLTLGFLMIWLCETIMNYCDNKILLAREEGKLYSGFLSLKIISLVVVVVGLSAVAETLETDYNSVGTLAIFACYLAKRFKAPYFVMMGATVAVLVLLIPSELPAILVIPLMFFYHGKKGRNINKWFFYLFYPVHLTIIWAVRMLTL